MRYVQTQSDMKDLRRKSWTKLRLVLGYTVSNALAQKILDEELIQGIGADRIDYRLSLAPRPEAHLLELRLPQQVDP